MSQFSYIDDIEDGDVITCACNNNFGADVPIVDGQMDLDQWDFGQHVQECPSCQGSPHMRLWKQSGQSWSMSLLILTRRPSQELAQRI